MSITVVHQSATIDGLQDQGTPARPQETLRKVFVVMAM